MILQACLNGARPVGAHPVLPANAQALAADARKVIGCGANELHLHVRDAAGKETLDPDVVDLTLKLVRQLAPGTLAGVSTGAWIEGDPERTMRLIGSWRILPDYASVNLGEPAAPMVMELLRRRNIGIEAGIATVADAERLVSLNVAPTCLRILVELDRETTFEEAKTAADAILKILSRAGSAKPILLHGFDATAWPMLAHAIQSGYSARIGLEDCLTLPDGTVAKDNCALVLAARRMMDRRLSA